MVGATRTRGGRRGATPARRGGCAALERRARQLQELATELVRARQEERQRLARVLHDHIQQLLVAAQMQVSLMPKGGGRAGEQATSLLREAIEASRSLSVELCPPVLREAGLLPAVQWLARGVEGRHDLRIEVKDDNWREPAEPDAREFLFDAVRELLDNAAGHGHATRAEVTLTRAASGGARVTVTDNGVGFDPETQKIRGAAAPGFGLFSLQQRAAFLGGGLAVDSAKRRGARVTVSLPAACRETTPAPRERGTPRAPSHSGGKRRPIRVIVADDHQILRQGLSELLRRDRGLRVVGQAEDGRQAVDLALQLKPDVVLMDVSMPRMSGIEATKRIVTQLPQTHVVGLSVHSERVVASKMLAAGASAYLTKGVAPKILISAIRKAAQAGGPHNGHGGTGRSLLK